MTIKKTWVEQEIERDSTFSVAIEQEALVEAYADVLYDAMEMVGVNQKELSRRLGVTKGFVSQLFNGRSNLGLRTIAKVAYVLGFRVEPPRLRGLTQNLVISREFSFVPTEQREAHWLCFGRHHHEVEDTDANILLA